jgi:hypothetical protein
MTSNPSQGVERGVQRGDSLLAAVLDAFDARAYADERAKIAGM